VFSPAIFSTLVLAEQYSLGVAPSTKTNLIIIITCILAMLIKRGIVFCVSVHKLKTNDQKLMYISSNKSVVSPRSEYSTL